MPTINFQEPTYKPNELRNMTPFEAKELGANALARLVRLGAAAAKVQTQGGITYFKRVRGPEPEFKEVSREILNRQELTIDKLIDKQIKFDQIKAAIGSYKAEDKIKLIYHSDKLLIKGTITIDTVPREIQYTPQNKVVAMASPGRNNPFYHYTGSEDTLEFTIDWYSNEWNRSDVITKCRELEAISKNDGYNSPPKIISIQWGKEDLLFNNTYWIIEKAPYKLQNFNRAYRGVKNQDKKEFNLEQTGDIYSTGLLPAQAYQQLTLKKVTINNSKTNNIMYGSEEMRSKMEDYINNKKFGIKVN